jgi:rRNA-processing protein FCF1
MAQSNEVVLDTNFLLVPTQFKIDIVGEIKQLVPGARLVVLSGSLRELENIKGGKTGMLFVEKNDFAVKESRGHVDDAIVNYAKENKAAVATNDIMLIQRLKEIGAPVIRVRKKQTLALEGHIKGGE